jgi:D-alanyl-D-alanine carboxypeptidase
MRRLSCTVLLGSVALSALGVSAQAPDRLTQVKSLLQARLDSLHANARFPGATVGVTLPDGRSFGIAVGFADTARKERMLPTHRMLQGSVGKTYFAAVALQLVREGKLDLDRKVESYLGSEPWWRAPDGRVRLPNGADITVRQLMTHSSGVVRYEFKQEFTRDLTDQPEKEWTPAERLAYVLDSAPPFAAGQGWEYSDTNYILLGVILEKITGTKLYDEVRRRILEPNALRNTIPSDRLVLPAVSQGYAGERNPFGGHDAMIVNGKFTVNPQLEWTGGGFASTSEDLSRWAKIVYEGRVFGEELLRQAVDGLPARGLGQGTRYGLGVIVRDTPLGVSYGHSGFFPGYLTEVRYYPAQRFAIALQFNTSVAGAIGRNTGAVLQDLAAIVAATLAQ